ncbi:MAG: arsenite methyltransferase [Bacillota bacterium]|nr:arsenite methyltransferase [Bacillota bacterium]
MFLTGLHLVRSLGHRCLLLLGRKGILRRLANTGHDERWHWIDRGQILDFLFATRGEGKRLLDFGPGDGWPSLGVARLAGEVVGVDASARRVEVCVENARCLGISKWRTSWLLSCKPSSTCLRPSTPTR